MKTALFHVDAFTDTPFTGNPAVVCLLPKPKTDDWMQAVAREMNQSETAFLHHEQDAYRLRWFTPACEVDLCGHATLAAAHVLWESGCLKPAQEALFETRSGRLTAHRKGDAIEMTFPSEPAHPADGPFDLSSALGAVPLHLGRNRMDYLAVLESESVVRALQPDLNLLRGISTRGVIVTARADTAEYDFVSRFFAPAIGIDEDPVTGSAHCCLAPYWHKELGKEEMTGYQASRRGGYVRTRIEGNTVVLGGRAVTLWRGEM